MIEPLNSILWALLMVVRKYVKLAQNGLIMHDTLIIAEVMHKILDPWALRAIIIIEILFAYSKAAAGVVSNKSKGGQVIRHPKLHQYVRKLDDRIWMLR